MGNEDNDVITNCRRYTTGPTQLKLFMARLVEMRILLRIFESKAILKEGSKHSYGWMDGLDKS